MTGARGPPAGSPVEIVPGSIPALPVPGGLPRIERPRCQVICRSCGRILDLPLELSELKLLAEFAHRAPDGWRVEGLSFTLTGACRRCREGVAAASVRDAGGEPR